jgi:hypothetical protein
MKRFTLVMMGLGVAATMQALAQGTGERRIDETRPQGGEPPGVAAQPLTEAQQAQVKAILSKHDPRHPDGRAGQSDSRGVPSGRPGGGPCHGRRHPGGRFRPRAPA